MDILESDYGVKESYLDMVQKDFLLQASNLIEYVKNEVKEYTNQRETRLFMKKICKDC